jgi:hypothetical protein
LGFGTLVIGISNIPPADAIGGFITIANVRYPSYIFIRAIGALKKDFSTGKVSADLTDLPSDAMRSACGEPFADGGQSWPVLSLYF